MFVHNEIFTRSLQKNRIKFYGICRLLKRLNSPYLVTTRCRRPWGLWATWRTPWRWALTSRSSFTARTSFAPSATSSSSLGHCYQETCRESEYFHFHFLIWNLNWIVFCTFLLFSQCRLRRSDVWTMVDSLFLLYSQNGDHHKKNLWPYD